MGVTEMSATKERRGPRLRRQRLTPTVRRVLALVVAGAAIGAAFAPPSPTGVAWVDVVERAAVAGLVAVAATRAHRWALVASSVMVTIAATGWWSVVGVVALLGAAWLVVPNRRHRVVAAAAGGAIAVTSMHLGVSWFAWSSTVWGILACGLVVGSAWGRLDAAERRTWLRGSLLACAGAVAWVGLAGVLAVVARGDLQSAQRQTERGVSFLRQGRTDEAVTAFRSAEDDFGSADRILNSGVLAPTRVIPVVGQNVAAVQDVVATGTSLAGAAAANTANVDYDQVRRPDGGVDLAVLQSFARPVRRTARVLDAARATVDRVPRRWLVPLVAEPFGKFAAEVRSLAREADVAVAVIEDAPAVLGADGARRYLILLGNPAESRDLGGHIGNWVELVVDDGRFDLVEVGGPLDLVDRTGASVGDASLLPPRLAEMRPALFPQNWGSFPDLPVVATTSARIFENVTGREVDGVVYADAEAFAAFVALSGPVQVPGLDGFALDRSNAARFVTVDQYERFPDDASADDALSAVIRTVFERVTTGELPGPRSLADLFAPLVAERRFSLWTTERSEADLLRILGLDGELRMPEGGDFVQVISRNANPSKIDRFLRRRVDVVAGWNQETGEVGSSVTVTAHNDAPVSGGTPTVLGNALGLPAGTNVSDLAIVSPFSLLRVTVDGRSTPSRTQWNGHGWYHQVRLVLPPGSRSTVRFELEGVVAAGAEYRLRVRGQPLLREDETTVRVVPSDGPPVTRRIRTPRTTDVVVRVDPS